jgi:hypothetical protein
MRTQMLFEVGRRDGLAAAVDDVFDPAGDLQVAVGVPADQVTTDRPLSRTIHHDQ